jgi:hypothetical protein
VAHVQARLQLHALATTPFYGLLHRVRTLRLSVVVFFTAQTCWLLLVVVGAAIMVLAPAAVVVLAATSLLLKHCLGV